MFHVHHIDYLKLWFKSAECLTAGFGCAPYYCSICGWPDQLQVISRSLTTLLGPQLTFLSPSQGQVHSLLCLAQPEATLSPWMRTQSISPWSHTSRSHKTTLHRSQVETHCKSWGKLNKGNLQIVHGVVDSIKNDWPNRLTKQKQEYEQRLQDAEAKEIAAIAEEKAWWRIRGQIESGSGNTWCQGWGVQGRGKHQAWSKDCRGKATYHKGIWSLLRTNSGTC